MVSLSQTDLEVPLDSLRAEELRGGGVIQGAESNREGGVHMKIHIGARRYIRGIYGHIAVHRDNGDSF